MEDQVTAPAPPLAASAEAPEDDGRSFAERFASEWLAQPGNHEAENGGSTYRWLPEIGEEEATIYLARFGRAYAAALAQLGAG